MRKERHAWRIRLGFHRNPSPMKQRQKALLNAIFLAFRLGCGVSGEFAGASPKMFWAAAGPAPGDRRLKEARISPTCGDGFRSSLTCSETGGDLRMSAGWKRAVSAAAPGSRGDGTERRFQRHYTFFQVKVKDWREFPFEKGRLPAAAPARCQNAQRFSGIF